MEVNGSSCSFRWTPTREQVAILESVYREGMRTPSTEQIQEMTRRLRQFGEIEGKNVFYWFQNHKARQRQKLKQEERAAILSRLYHSQPILPPLFPPHPSSFHHHYRPDVVYAPYCVAMPQPGASCGYYHQTQVPNAFLPGSIKAVPKQVLQPTPSDFVVNEAVTTAHHETLQLFPLQPSGIVPGERSRSSVTSASAEEGGECEGEGGSDHENVSFFNFFGPSQGN